MQLSDFDFSKCRFNPLAQTFTTNISKAIPEFDAYSGKKRKEVFRYVVALCDKSSPLWAKEPEYFPRKVLAAQLCELSAETLGGSLNTFTRDILENKNDEVNKMVAAYLSYTGDIEWSMLMTELEMYHGYYHKQAGGSLLDNKEYEVMLKLKDNIQERTRKLFGSGKDEEAQHIKNLLYARADRDRQKMHPESVVKMIEKDGDLPDDWNPYGPKYKVQKLKYYKDAEKG